MQHALAGIPAGEDLGGVDGEGCHAGGVGGGGICRARHRIRRRRAVVHKLEFRRPAAGGVEQVPTGSFSAW